jgi:hypothetical protein
MSQAPPSFPLVQSISAKLAGHWPDEAPYALLRNGLLAVHESVERDMRPRVIKASAEGTANPAARSEPSSRQRRDYECTAIENDAAKNLCVRMHDISELQRAGIPVGWSESAFPTLFSDGCTGLGDPQRDTCGGLSGRVANSHWLGNFGVLVLGWFLTALACTLGAPFWFDALSKLMQLRAAGRKPDEPTAKSADANSPPQTMLARSSVQPGAASDPVPEPMSDALTDAEKALSGAEIGQLQRALQMSGARIGGYFDGPTRQAIQKWQLSSGQDGTGRLTHSQIQSLMTVSSGNDNDYVG